MTYRMPPAPIPDAEDVETHHAYGKVTRDHLGDLMRACENARRGYEADADKVKDEVVAAAFRIYGAQRAEFAEELANLGAVFGAEKDEDGTIEGMFRRAWVAVKSAFTDGDPEAVIESVIEIEEETIEEYSEALEANLPPQVDGPVRRQYANVQEAVTHLRQLEERYDD